MTISRFKDVPDLLPFFSHISPQNRMM